MIDFILSSRIQLLWGCCPHKRWLFQVHEGLPAPSRRLLFCDHKPTSQVKYHLKARWLSWLVVLARDEKNIELYTMRDEALVTLFLAWKLFLSGEKESMKENTNEV